MEDGRGDSGVGSGVKCMRMCIELIENPPSKESRGCCVSCDCVLELVRDFSSICRTGGTCDCLKGKEMAALV